MEKHANYYEGILQLRKPTKEITEFTKNQIKKRPDVSATQIKKVKNGYDYYITSQHFLQNLGKKLKNTFTGDLKISKRLFSRNKQTSRDIYRINVLFQPYNVKKGSIIDYKGEKIKIIEIKKKIHAKTIKTGKKIMIDFKELR